MNLPDPLPKRRASERLRGWLGGWMPEPFGAGMLGRVRACIGALLALFVIVTAGQVSGLGGELPLLIAPLGASAVIVFTLPASPLAQPWPLVGGNVVSALVGVSCARWVPDVAIAAPLAVAAAIAVMFILRCLHPPGGAVALSAVIGGPATHALGYQFAWVPVGLASVVMLAAALVFNNLTRHRYPRLHRAHPNPHATADPPTTDRIGVSPKDLDAVLARYETLDVSRDDLEEILAQAQLQAWQRHFGRIRCADIMSRDVVHVMRNARSADAWALLQTHRIKALPVTDAAGRVVGIVTAANFAEHRRAATGRRRAARWWQQLGPAARATGQTTEPVEPVERIMSAPVQTVDIAQSIVDLYPLMADQGHHHIPVVDADGRLAGMITQSDLVAAVYRQGLAGPSGLRWQAARSVA